MIAIPEIEWSTTVTYEEGREELSARLQSSLSERVESDTAGELAGKIGHWVGEM
ncbi:YueH family protein [Metabacillus litoralis]|nr:YueH family protein [Metabacillus litoralis]UHA61974.1 YueH family protein [Metabacillus litoralis]